MPLDLNTLGISASVSFEAYKAAYDDQNTVDPVEAYYTELAFQSSSLGPSENSSTAAYAARQAEIATNSGVNAKILNNYSNNKGLEVGSDDWLRVQHAKMQLDFQRRTEVVNSGDEGHLNAQELFIVSEDAHENNALDPALDPLFVPMQDALRDGLTSEVQQDFDDINNGNGVLNFIVDAIALVDGPYPNFTSIDVSSQQSISQRLGDWVNEADWIADMVRSLSSFLNNDTSSPPGDVLAAQLVLQTLADWFSESNIVELLDGGANLFEVLEAIADGVTGLGDDLSWARDNPQGILKELPPWLADDLLPIFEAAENPPHSPLVLDLDGDGIELAAVSGAGSVYWDLDQDGMAEASGWITGGDGLLVIDTNGDGIVTDHTELFGDGTGFANGFLALASYDTNSDGYITAADTQFGDLLVWVDTNADGYSQADELHTLDDLLITSIDLGYSDVNYKISGNDILQESTFTINGQTHDIVDAWFAYDSTNTVYAQDYTLDVRTLFLPTLRGYGNLPDLHIAMSLDNGTDGLLEMVQEMAAADLTTLFDPAFGVKDKILDAMYRWAGVQDVVDGSRGLYADAKELGFLEALVGQPYLQWGLHSNPDYRVGTTLHDSFDYAYNALQARVLMQTAAADLFETGVTYNPFTDTFEGTFVLDTVALDALMMTHSGSDEELLESFVDLFLFLDHTVGIDNLSASDVQAINDTLYALNPTLDLESLMLQVYPVAQSISGTTGDDIYRGSPENDSLSRSDGNDVIYGRQGNDYIDGGEGNDIIIGGSGDDGLHGHAGDDVFIFGLNSGTDTLTEYIGYGDDEIRLVDGISPDDIRTWVDSTNSGNLRIKNIVTGDEIIVDGFTSGGGPTTVTQRIERIVFEGDANDPDDDIVWDISQGLLLNDIDDTNTVAGSDLGDVISANGGDDYVYGLGGDDQIDGGSGNDFIDGGNGIDTATFSGVYADYTIVDNVNSFIVTDNVGSDGIDTLLDVEQLEFSDGTYDLATATFTPATVGPNIITGTSGTDVLNGTDGEDEISGGGANDTIFGGLGNDTIYGDAGHDTIEGGEGDDTMTGGNGYDVLSYRSATSGVTIDLGITTAQNTGGAGTDTISGFRAVHGSDFNDVITGSDVSNTLYGFDGDDIIRGLRADDNIDGGNGNDTVIFRSSFDQYTITDHGTHMAVSSAGYHDANDTIYNVETFEFTDGLYDVASATFAQFNQAPTADDDSFAVDENTTLSGNVISNDSDPEGDVLSVSVLSNVSNGTLTLNGSGTFTYTPDANFFGADSFTYTLSDGDLSDTATVSITVNQTGGITGTENADDLYGTDADDFMYGLGGNDIMRGSLGADTFDGGDGYDDVRYANAPDAVSIDLSTGVNTGTYAVGDTYTNVEQILGSAYQDTFRGGVGDDVFKGWWGADTFYASAGNDVFISHQNDADVFIFEAATAFDGVDKIRFFSTSNGVIDISDVISGYDPLTDAISDFVQFTDDGTHGYMEVDIDGTANGTNFVQIAQLDWTTGLDATTMEAAGNLKTEVV
jgi:Ca2+-binding RTX toxin-like protein